MRKPGRVPRLSLEERLEQEDRGTSSLAGLALILFLLVFGLFVFHKLQAVQAIQDCVMSGRTNCAPIPVDRP